MVEHLSQLESINRIKEILSGNSYLRCHQLIAVVSTERGFLNESQQNDQANVKEDGVACSQLNINGGFRFTSSELVLTSHLGGSRGKYITSTT